MTAIRGTLLLGAALVLGSVAGAEAADINYGGSIKDGGYAAPMVAPEPRFYFRVDGGYAFHDDPTMVEDGIYDLTETSIDDTWTIGGGVGMYFSRNVRADITVDHRFEADAEGRLANHNATLEGTRRFGMSSTVALANVYYDFDTRSRFTPYVGAGLGFVRHDLKDGTVVPDCGCTGTIDSNSTMHVAAALMAGVSVALRDRLTFDAGYRFLYLGDAETGVSTLTGGTISVEDMYAHEVRLGLRYDIN